MPVGCGCGVIPDKAIRDEYAGVLAFWGFGVLGFWGFGVWGFGVAPLLWPQLPGRAITPYPFVGLIMGIIGPNSPSW